MAISKQKAKNMAYENTTYTYGQLLAMLDKVDMSKPSKVNPNIPKDMVIDIMRNGFAGKPLDEVVKTTWLNHRDNITLTVDGINMCNILRECM